MAVQLKDVPPGMLFIVDDETHSETRMKPPMGAVLDGEQSDGQVEIVALHDREPFALYDTVDGRIPVRQLCALNELVAAFRDLADECHGKADSDEIDVRQFVALSKILGIALETARR